MSLDKVLHTLVIVRPPEWRSRAGLVCQFGANRNFFGGIGQAFCVRKRLRLANWLDFFVTFFIKEKSKKNVSN